MFYNKEGNPITRIQWEQLMEDSNYREVAKTTVESGYLVSTVRLWLNHGIIGVGKPIIFETMVFGNDDVSWNTQDEYTRRFATIEEAKAYHQAVVQALSVIESIAVTPISEDTLEVTINKTEKPKKKTKHTV